MTAKSDELIAELVSACVAFGREKEPDWQTRIETARCAYSSIYNRYQVGITTLSQGGFSRKSIKSASLQIGSTKYLTNS